MAVSLKREKVDDRDVVSSRGEGSALLYQYRIIIRTSEVSALGLLIGWMANALHIRLIFPPSIRCYCSYWSVPVICLLWSVLAIANIISDMFINVLCEPTMYCLLQNCFNHCWSLSTYLYGSTVFTWLQAGPQKLFSNIVRFALWSDWGLKCKPGLAALVYGLSCIVSNYRSHVCTKLSTYVNCLFC